MAHMVDKATQSFFFVLFFSSLTSRLRNNVYTFSHLLPTMHEIERLCVSENVCSTPKCSQVVNKNKHIINSGFLLFPKDNEGEVLSKCFSVRTDIRFYCFYKYFLNLCFFHSRRNEGRPLKRLLDV